MDDQRTTREGGGMKLPAWSALIIAPLLIMAFSFNAIRRSENPTALALVMLGISLVCGVVACGVLAMLERSRK
jgi:hypothetical protein